MTKSFFHGTNMLLREEKIDIWTVLQGILGHWRGFTPMYEFVVFDQTISIFYIVSIRNFTSPVYFWGKPLCLAWFGNSWW